MSDTAATRHVEGRLARYAYRDLGNARTVFCSGAGHAFLFQHPEESGGVVLDFLDRQEQ
ncbi:alpha/beta fold hydrolase [Streptomyces tauricus]|uniref:alpha/beta fold hydrolase n=1 Tax=Streptomyces TaxID=1883 RepID=UPI0033A27F2A